MQNQTFQKKVYVLKALQELVNFYQQKKKRKRKIFLLVDIEATWLRSIDGTFRWG